LVTGQTYPRKYDSRVLGILSGVAQSAHKFSNDIRLLQSVGEMEEPFGQSQVGSSTMAYKRNPTRSERMAALARHVICTSLNPAFTAAGQWFERTIDDSANKRLSIPEAFLARRVTGASDGQRFGEGREVRKGPEKSGSFHHERSKSEVSSKASWREQQPVQTGGCNRKVEPDAAALTEAESRAAGTAERLIADASR
jgi:hypothetical protein